MFFMSFYANKNIHTAIERQIENTIEDWDNPSLNGFFLTD